MAYDALTPEEINEIFEAHFANNPGTIVIYEQDTNEQIVAKLKAELKPEDIKAVKDLL